MKRFAILILVFVAASVLLLSCRAPEVQTQKWRLQHQNPAGSDEDKIIQAFAKGITQDTNGRITIEVFPASSLGYQTEAVASAVQSGVLELGTLSFGWIEGSNPLVGVTHLPSIATTEDGIVKATKAVAPYIQQEMAKRNLVNLVYYRNANGHLYSKKPVQTVADWKGLKLRSQGASQDWYFAKLGATPVSMSKEEMYPALAQGTIDGVLYSPSSAWAAKLYEVLSYYDLWEQPSVSFGLLIQKSKLESLPKATQDVIRKRAGEMEEAFWQAVFYSGKNYIKQLEGKGTKIIEPSLAERNKVSEISKAYWDIWLQKSGKDGLATLNAALKAAGLPAYK